MADSDHDGRGVLQSTIIIALDRYVTTTVADLLDSQPTPTLQPQTFL
jgi:hypothetical protein